MNAALNTSTQELVTSKLLALVSALCLRAGYAAAAITGMVIFSLLSAIAALSLHDSLRAQHFDDAALAALLLVLFVYLLHTSFKALKSISEISIFEHIDCAQAAREATAKLKATADQAAALFAAAVTLFADLLTRVTLALTFKPRITRAPSPPPLPARRRLHASIQQKHYRASLRTARA